MSSVAVTRPYGTVALGGYLYIASQGENKLIRVNLDLSNRTDIYSIATPIGLTTDGTYLYITRAGGQIYQINPSTGLPTASGAPWATTAAYYLAADTSNRIMYVSTGSTSITKIAYDIVGNIGTVTPNWSTGYTSAAQMFVNNSDNYLYISDDVSVKRVSLTAGGAPTTIITPTGPASGNQSITILTNYLYVGSNNGQNISVYNYPGFSLVNNSWKTSLSNVDNLYSFNGSIYASIYGGSVNLYERYDICFLKGTKIKTQNGYQAIEDLKVGDLVQTSLNGFVPVEIIKQSSIYNKGDNTRITDRLYILEKSFYPELFENLVITGGHSLLVDNLTQQERDQTVSQLGNIFVTENKYRLLACIDEKTIPYPNEGTFDIYHICLENEHDQGNYGIYANGLLVESCCKRHIS